VQAVRPVREDHGAVPAHDHAALLRVLLDLPGVVRDELVLLLLGAHDLAVLERVVRPAEEGEHVRQDGGVLLIAGCCSGISGDLTGAEGLAVEGQTETFGDLLTDRRGACTVQLEECDDRRVGGL